MFFPLSGRKKPGEIYIRAVGERCGYECRECRGVVADMVAFAGESFDQECGTFNGCVAWIARGYAFLDFKVEAYAGYGKCHCGRFGKAVQAASPQDYVAVVEAAEFDSRGVVYIAVECACAERGFGLTPFAWLDQQPHNHGSYGE